MTLLEPRRWRLVALVSTLLLAGCIHPPNTVSYDRDVRSPTDFTRQLMIELAAPDHRLPEKITVRHSDDHTLHVLDTRFWPSVSQDEVDANFGAYCQRLGGDYREGLCTYDHEHAAHFYVQLQPTDAQDEQHEELRMIVTEALVPPGWSVLTAAQQQGYVTRLGRQAAQIQRGLAAPTPPPVAAPAP